MVQHEPIAEAVSHGRSARARMIGVVTGLEAEARIGARLGVARAGGGTPAGAARAAEALVAQGATALISFGLAGGLNPALAAGTLIIPAEIITEDAIYATDPALTDRLGGPAHTLHATPVIAATAAEKHRLFAALRADAVDMESGAMAEVAVAHGVRFAVLRAICDPAGASLPPAAMIALDQAGAIGAWRVARSVLGDPRQVPALLRLARDAAAARSALLNHLNTVRL